MCQDHISVILSYLREIPTSQTAGSSQRWGQCPLGVDNGEELCRDDFVPFLVVTLRGAEVWVFGYNASVMCFPMLIMIYIGKLDIRMHSSHTVFVPRKWVFRCFTQSQAAFQVMLPVSFLIFLAVWLVLLPAAYHTTGTDMGLLSPAALASHNLNLDCGFSWSNVCWLHGWGMVAVGKPWCSTVSERSPVFAATDAAG